MGIFQLHPLKLIKTKFYTVLHRRIFCQLYYDEGLEQEAGKGESATMKKVATLVTSV